MSQYAAMFTILDKLSGRTKLVISKGNLVSKLKKLLRQIVPSSAPVA